MGIEVITVSAGGGTYTAFESSQVRAAFHEAARSFRLEVAAELGASATNAIFALGTQVQIYANADLLLSGYVDHREPKLSATEATISVSGRSKSADLVDSSAVHDTGYFEKKDPMEIGNAVAQGIAAQFETDQQLDKRDWYHVSQGKTVYNTVEEMTRADGMTITGTAEGNAKITKAGSNRHAGGIFEGINLLSGSAQHNSRNRHSKITARGQRPIGHGAENLEVEGTVDDSEVQRTRPLILLMKEDTTKARAGKRAKNRRDRAAGNALRASIEVQGFRDDGGKVWEPGWLVWTESPFLDIAQDMLIESADYHQSAKGSITKLGLVDPQAYGGSAGKGNKSGSAWSMDDSGPEGDSEEAGT